MSNNIRENFYQNLSLIRELYGDERRYETPSKSKPYTGNSPRAGGVRPDTGAGDFLEPTPDPLGKKRPWEKIRLPSKSGTKLSPAPETEEEKKKRKEKERKERIADMKPEPVKAKEMPAEPAKEAKPDTVKARDPSKYTPEIRPVGDDKVPEVKAEPDKRVKREPIKATDVDPKTITKPEPKPEPTPEPKRETKDDKKTKEDDKTKEDEKKDKNFCQRYPWLCLGVGALGAMGEKPKPTKAGEFSLKPVVSEPKSSSTMAHELQAARRQAKAWNVNESFANKLKEIRERMEDEEDSDNPFKPKKLKPAEFSKTANTSAPQTSETEASRLQGARRQAKQWNENFEIIRILSAKETNAPEEITIGENTISINKRIAKKIVNIYESVNKENKNKIKKMLNEDITEVRKLINFAIKA